MSNYLTSAEGPNKRFLYYAYNEDFAVFAKRYFNFDKELSNEVFYAVIEKYYLKVKAGEIKLWDNARYQLEKVGANVIFDFWKKNRPDLAKGSNHRG